MNLYSLVIILIFLKVPTRLSVVIDNLNCGVDEDAHVKTGDVDIETYPWLGVLFYYNDESMDDDKAVTPVVLIQAEFVLGAAADIGELPKTNFRKYTRVLLAQHWESHGLRVRNYIMHPEFSKTYNTLALVQLTKPVQSRLILPICPAPVILRNPDFYVVRYKDNYEILKKEIIPVSHVPGTMCKDFYVAAQLYAKNMRPPHVVCAVSLETNKVCVWEAGAALVARDVWGRWQLLGFGVRGPGCGAPSRYLDMMSYYPWIESSLDKFRMLTISKINKHKYVLRSSEAMTQRFGACDKEERKNLLYREVIVLRTDNSQFQFLSYNMTINADMEMTCLTLEAVNASASSEMRIRHRCLRHDGKPCYRYDGSKFEVAIFLMFSDKCLFEMNAYGFTKRMTLIDIMEWKWEEGTYYKDFELAPIEYRGQQFMTGFGFEPLDIGHWIPEYDIWTTTEFDNATWSSTTSPPDKEQTGGAPEEEAPPTRLITTVKTKKTLKPKKMDCWLGWFWFQPQWHCAGVLKIFNKYSTTTLKPTSKWQGK